MNRFKKILLIILTGVLAYGCYDPLEINTENANKVEIPLKFAAPLMDGSFLIEFDSLFDAEELGDDIISYENDVAYFKYDTIIDFYEELSEFLTMDDIDFSDMTTFEESFSLLFDLPDIEVPIEADFTIGGVVDTSINDNIVLSPQDTFKTKYGTNSIFIVPADDVNYQLEVLQVGDSIDFEIPFEVYKVGVASGVVNLYMRTSTLLDIADDYMTMTPSVDFTYNNPPLPLYDTTFSETLSIPIYKNMPKLPEGVNVIADVKIASLLGVDDDMPLDQHYVVSSLDTAFTLDLADYYYYSADGAGRIALDVNVYMQIDSPEDTAMVPLPDTLFFGTYIEDLVFDQVVFNYGIDTAMSDEQDIELDVFSSIPNDLDIEGFRLSNPEFKLKVQSNLGFSALFDITKFWFATDGDPQYITQDGTESITIPIPTNPLDATVYISAGKDSILLDTATSRLGEVELINAKSLVIGYNVIVNPEDDAGEVGKHNFFYDYPDDIAASMFDVKLSAEVRIPFEFKFEKISYKQVMESPLKENDLDSIMELGETDSISLKVKLLTKDFPFNAVAQFYFDELNNMGELVHLDSMFDQAETLLPSSSDGVWDSVSWSLTLDSDKYNSLKETDSLIMDISFSMDEDDYFQLEKSATTEIGYKFSISESSFVIKQE